MNSKTSFTLRWRGKTSGPYNLAALRTMLDRDEVSLMHEVLCHGRWIVLEELLAQSSADAPPPAKVPLPPLPPPPPVGPPPVPVEEEFFVVQNGQKQGPYTKSVLKQLVSGGVVAGDDQAWKEGLADWIPLSQLMELPAAQSQSLPLSPANQVTPPSPVSSQSSGSGPAKSRLTFILLAFFLGPLCVHNFYAGYTGKAVAQLLLFWLLIFTVLVPLIVCIWILVEMVTVTHDSSGRPFA